MKDTDALGHIAESDPPAERPSEVRRKKPGGAEASPNFNKLPRPTARRMSADERDVLGRVVRQPPILEAFQKPLKPIGVRR